MRRAYGWLGVLAGLLIGPLPITSHAQAPDSIIYQGRLADGSGYPISTSTQVTFSIYDTATSETSLWSRTIGVTPDEDGVFTVLLGPLSDAEFMGSMLYLGIALAGFTEMTPRQPIVSSPYALNSDHAQISDTAMHALSIADGAVTANAIANDAVTSNALAGNSVDGSAIADGSLGLAELNQSGAQNGQVIKWNGSVWAPADDESGTAGTDVDWTIAGSNMYSGVGGNVGIGTSSPSEKLTVEGNLLVVGQANIGVGNINTGTGAFVAGTNNRARGDYSVVSGGGGSADGDSNTASAHSSVVGGGTKNTAGAISSTVGGGVANVAMGQSATISGGQLGSAMGHTSTIGGGASNVAGGSYSTVAGGVSNQANAVGSTVGGGSSNRSDSANATVAGGFLNVADGHSSTVGGGSFNHAHGFHATVAGGGGSLSSDSNSAMGDWSTISGGRSNLSKHYCSVVSGGLSNDADTNLSTVSGGHSNHAGGYASTIGGGEVNTTAGNASTIGGGEFNIANTTYATVSGGYANKATGYSSTVAGGRLNTVNGFASTVPGGYNNTAGGNYSLAAGANAYAAHAASFVWSDGSASGQFTSTASNQFNVLSIGGVRIVTNSSLSAGVTLSSGSSSWSSVSDSTMKEHIRSVDGQDLLQRLAQLPVYRWNYKAQSSEVEHIGPMAQDFYALFGLGENDKTINTLDPDGIALAAIQELHRKTQEIDSLKVRLEALEQIVASLQSLAE